MIANLNMYARPQLAEAHARFWQLIRENLVASGLDAPKTLSQDAEEFDTWTHPDLVLSQTCGMPYRTRLHDRVSLVGTPDYGVENCPPGYYRSALVVRSDETRSDPSEFRDAIFAYNQTISQSGFAAPYWHLHRIGFWFENRLQTGQHVLSARAVVDGRADIAALDAVSFRMMVAHDDFAKGLKVLDWTAPTPSLPLITSRNNDAGLVYQAVKDAIRDMDVTDRTLLGLRGIVQIPKADYLAVPNPPN